MLITDPKLFKAIETAIASGNTVYLVSSDYRGRSPPGENKKPRRGARRVAMRPLMFVRRARRKNKAWTTKNACGY